MAEAPTRWKESPRSENNAVRREEAMREICIVNGNTYADYSSDRFQLWRRICGNRVVGDEDEAKG